MTTVDTRAGRSVDTTRGENLGGHGTPRYLARRITARIIDTLIGTALAAWVSWFVLSGPVGQAFASGGFDSFTEWASQWDPDQPLSGAAGAVWSQVRPAIINTVLLSALTMWLYESVFTTLLGTTPGKAMQQLRLVIDQPRVTGLAEQRPGLLARAVRMLARAALVVLPIVLAAGLTVAAILGVPGAANVGEIAVAVALLASVAWLVTGKGLHGAVSGTTVVPFSWMQLRSQARQRAEQLGTRQVAPALQRAERIANRSQTGRLVTSELRRAGIDAAHPQQAMDAAKRAAHAKRRGEADALAAARESTMRVAQAGGAALAGRAGGSTLTGRAGLAGRASTSALTRRAGTSALARRASSSALTGRVRGSVLTKVRGSGSALSRLETSPALRRAAGSVLTGARSSPSVLTGDRAAVARQLSERLPDSGLMRDVATEAFSTAQGLGR